MSRDLGQLVYDAALRPHHQRDPARLAERGRRRRRTRRAAVGAGTAAVMVAAAVTVTEPAGTPTPPEIVDQPSPTVAPAPDPTETDETVAAEPVALEIVDHAAGGSAITGGFGSVWIAGPYRYETEPDGRDWAEIVRASPDGRTLEAVIEVPVTMRHVVTTDESVWAVSVADGAQRQNLLIRIDPDTNEVIEQIDLGDFSTGGIVMTDAGELLLVQGNGHPAEVLWLSPNGQIISQGDLSFLGSATAVANHDGSVAIADEDGVLVIAEEVLLAADDPATDELVEVTGAPTSLGFAADGLWKASYIGQHVVNIGPEATTAGPDRFLLDTRPVALLTNPVSEGFFAVGWDGQASYGARGRDEVIPVAQGPTDVAAAGWIGPAIWIIGHDDVQLIPLEQQGGPVEAAPTETPDITPPPAADGLELGPGGVLVATSSLAYSLELRDAPSGDVLRRLGVGSEALPVPTVSDDGTQLYTTVWMSSCWQEVVKVDPHVGTATVIADGYGVAVSPDGRHLAWLQHVDCRYSHPDLVVYDLDTGSAQVYPTPGWTGHRWVQLDDLAFSPDASRIAFVQREGRISGGNYQQLNPSHPAHLQILDLTEATTTADADAVPLLSKTAEEFHTPVWTSANTFMVAAEPSRSSDAHGTTARIIEVQTAGDSSTTVLERDASISLIDLDATGEYLLWIETITKDPGQRAQQDDLWVLDDGTPRLLAEDVAAAAW